MFFSSHQQPSVEKCETVFKGFIENLLLQVALNAF